MSTGEVLDLDAIEGRATAAHEWLKRDQREKINADWLPFSVREHFEHDFPAVLRALGIFADEVERLNAKPAPGAGVVFLIWSNKHRMWWRPDAMGYTPEVAEAGRYTEADAVKHVAQSAMHGKLDQVSCMVAAPDNWQRTS